jgi:hypothetical protein
MAYTIENALFQWREGERTLARTPEPARADLDLAADAVIEELRRRLGSSFVVAELAELYAEGTDWASAIAWRHAAGGDATAVVDAAFIRYAREASDFAGGRARESHAKP